MIPRSVPWADWDEWIVVKNGLHSYDRNHQLAAIEMVEMWKSRGRLPHSVDLSTTFIEIRYNDCAYDSDIQKPYRSDTELQLMYSLATVRAVNGLADPGQQTYFAESVMSLASKVGVPAWIVEMRHDATHGQIPSLQLLRQGAVLLIDYYWRNYWMAQTEHLQGLSLQSLPQSKPTKSKKSKLNERDDKSDRSVGFAVSDLFSDENTKPSVMTFTRIADIFTPLFVQCTIMEPLPDRPNRDALCTAARTAFLKQRHIWGATVKKILSYRTAADDDGRSRAGWSLLNGFLAAALKALGAPPINPASAGTSDHIYWMLQITVYWTKFMLSFSDSGAHETATSDSKLGSALRGFQELYHRSAVNVVEPEVMLQLEKALSAWWDTPTASSDDLLVSPNNWMDKSEASESQSVSSEGEDEHESVVGQLVHSSLDMWSNNPRPDTATGLKRRRKEDVSYQSDGKPHLGASWQIGRPRFREGPSSLWPLGVCPLDVGVQKLYNLTHSE